MDPRGSNPQRDAIEFDGARDGQGDALWTSRSSNGGTRIGMSGLPRQGARNFRTVETRRSRTTRDGTDREHGESEEAQSAGPALCSHLDQAGLSVRTGAWSAPYSHRAVGTSFPRRARGRVRRGGDDHAGGDKLRCVREQAPSTLTARLVNDDYDYSFTTSDSTGRLGPMDACRAAGRRPAASLPGVGRRGQPGLDATEARARRRLSRLDGPRSVVGGGASR